MTMSTIFAMWFWYHISLLVYWTDFSYMFILQRYNFKLIFVRNLISISKKHPWITIIETPSYPTFSTVDGLKEEIEALKKEVRNQMNPAEEASEEVEGAPISNSDMDQDV